MCSGPSRPSIPLQGAANMFTNSVSMDLRQAFTPWARYSLELDTLPAGLISESGSDTDSRRSFKYSEEVRLSQEHIRANMLSYSSVKIKPGPISKTSLVHAHAYMHMHCLMLIVASLVKFTACKPKGYQHAIKRDNPT